MLRMSERLIGVLIVLLLVIGVAASSWASALCSGFGFGTPPEFLTDEEEAVQQCYCHAIDCLAEPHQSDARTLKNQDAFCFSTTEEITQYYINKGFSAADAKERAEGPQGFFDPSTGCIVISLDADLTLGGALSDDGMMEFKKALVREETMHYWDFLTLQPPPGASPVAEAALAYYSELRAAVSHLTILVEKVATEGDPEVAAEYAALMASVMDYMAYNHHILCMLADRIPATASQLEIEYWWMVICCKIESEEWFDDANGLLGEPGRPGTRPAIK